MGNYSTVSKKKNHLLSLVTVAFQLLGILLSLVFWNLLVEMSESEDMVDFKFLKRAGYKYSELDLSDAGCCMCLPRDGGYLPVPDSEPDTWAPDPSIQACG